MLFRVPRCSLLPLAATVSLVACGNDGVLPPTAMAPRGTVVLDGFIQPSYTVVSDSGSETRRIPLAAPNEFDAGGFEVRNDTALATSSRGAGDLLFITELATGVVRRLQMPPRSNPARARLLGGGGGRALIGVPLRDSGTVILAAVAPGGDATFERLTDLGTCPVDVFRHGGATWVVDANATCATDYRATGAMRLIRIPATGARQVITLDGLRGSSAAVSVVGDVAYISAGGDADFSTFPFTLVAGGAITRVDLRTGTVLGTRAMPAGTYGGSARLGLDGNLHVTLFEDLSSFRNRTISLRLPDLTPVGTREPGAEWLALRDATGGSVACGSGVADENGRLHCIQNRTGSATFLLVFAPDGALVREVAAGQGGVDMRLRR